MSINSHDKTHIAKTPMNIPPEYKKWTLNKDYIDRTTLPEPVARNNSGDPSFMSLNFYGNDQLKTKSK